LESYYPVDNWVLRPTSRVLCSNGLWVSTEPFFLRKKRGEIAPERNPAAKPILRSKIAEECLSGHPLDNPVLLFLSLCLLVRHTCRNFDWSTRRDGSMLRFMFYDRIGSM
jgi:hypothetical protein